MSRFGIYAYVDGSDLVEVFAEIESRSHHFLVSREWQTPVRFISTHFARTPDLGPDDLPAWNLGFNLDWPSAIEKRNEAERDISELANFLSTLNQATGRDFVFGVYDNENKTSEDFYFLTSRNKDISRFLKLLKELNGDS